MRKKHKEITDIARIESILRKATVCRIALAEANRPYIVPLNFGYRDGRLYFHCAREGKKIDILRRNTIVCFEVEADTEFVKAGDACDWGMKFLSVIGYGHAVFLGDREAKRHGLRIIMEHYSDGDYVFPDDRVDLTEVIRVDVEEMTGKKSGYE